MSFCMTWFCVEYSSTSSVVLSTGRFSQSSKSTAAFFGAGPGPTPSPAAAASVAVVMSLSCHLTSWCSSSLSELLSILSWLYFSQRKVAILSFISIFCVIQPRCRSRMISLYGMSVVVLLQWRGVQCGVLVSFKFTLGIIEWSQGT